jgi:hypothetical protein
VNSDNGDAVTRKVFLGTAPPLRAAKIAAAVGKKFHFRVFSSLNEYLPCGIAPYQSPAAIF